MLKEGIDYKSNFSRWHGYIIITTLLFCVFSLQYAKLNSRVAIVTCRWYSRLSFLFHKVNTSYIRYLLSLPIWTRCLSTNSHKHVLMSDQKNARLNWTANECSVFQNVTSFLFKHASAYGRCLALWIMMNISQFTYGAVANTQLINSDVP